MSKTYPNGARVTYSYDANYNLISETNASGGTTAYEYDKIGRNTAIIDALGNRTAVHYANGYTTTYDYDLLNRLIQHETLDIDGNPVVQYIYTLGTAGEHISVVELDRTIEFIMKYQMK